MAGNKVTMQDVADSLGFSRNTVSKALNGHLSVPVSTRSLIIQKAAQMNYKNYAALELTGAQKGGGTIAFFTSSMPDKNHFGAPFLSGFTEHMSLNGYTLAIYVLRGTDVTSSIAPANFSAENTAGILCIELFNPVYCDFICKMGIPVLFADTFVNQGYRPLHADIVMMENTQSTATLVQYMIEKGARTVGFVGDSQHCQSFFERWESYHHTLRQSGITMDERLCILKEDSSLYQSSAWLEEQLLAMPFLPDAFMCANDAIAADLLRALKSMNKNIPEEIMVTGFDNSPESRVSHPSLTTIQIPSYEMGIFAAEQMLHRIKNPLFPHTTTYVQTVPIFRESTR
jgi:LacI family transcriptional regulator